MVINNPYFKELETELKIRGYSPKTIKAYIDCNSKLLIYSNKESTDITSSDVKAFLAHLISDKKLKPRSVSLFLSSIKYFYQEIMHRDVCRGIKPPKLDKKLPTVLTKEEVKSLFSVIKNKKHRILARLLYSSGLRVSEAVSLRINDMDLQENTGIVKSGKGGKDRNFILSLTLNFEIQAYSSSRKEHSEYLFPAAKGHISERQAQKVISTAARLAGIKKRVHCHVLRSTFATHLLDAGTDIRVIQELLGHANLSTTERYTKVSTELIKKVRSPLDRL
ncbi:tyrosine-type recombinase/integrase [Candidatus Woesearchaeota archaeon]|nr:MAG: phage integrase family protein [archaeon GW2011_AR4]MBS3129508.1 tyrosine-type recombinase/integrase [Candidatus Woesearchaeota archaeon]HIH38889.1 tyrosine-type recombinase/integrase [Candidatus Woesearchaeota archaeon]HIH48295.1 tyrosine-type recombinase/integrase [Candidatus Woesearchaeota archaeon]HIJ03795.1 tyrosine-type recombinase/integrase [Candidatus Woesearchaeota archaeon]